jgi:uncharacterized phage protein (TIGR01671 family)
MSRELKFRIWDKELKDFIYTEKYTEKVVNESDFCIGGDFSSFSFDGGRDWSEGVFQQFTGLKDKNGTEIYEGDVIEFSLKDFKQIYQVYWNQEMLRWDYASLKDNIEDPCACEYNLFERNFSNAKIVGNIFESPELFKECKPIR